MRVDEREWQRAFGTPPRLGIVSWGVDRLAAEEVYRPLRRGAKVATKMRRRIVSSRLPVPAGSAKPPSLVSHSLVAPYVVDASGLAAMAGSSGRLLVGVARDGRLHTVLKVGEASDPGLANEGAWLASPPTGIRTPQLAADVSDASRRVLVIEAVHGFWRAPIASVDAVVDVVIRLQSLDAPVVHGDLAPWNLVEPEGPGRRSEGRSEGRSDPLAIDWERARWAAEPLTDLAQYLVQEQGQLRRHPGASTILSDLVRPGGPGWRCLTGVGLDPTTAPAHLRTTLESGIVEQTAFEPARRLWAELAAALAAG